MGTTMEWFASQTSVCIPAGGGGGGLQNHLGGAAYGKSDCPTPLVEPPEAGHPQAGLCWKSSRPVVTVPMRRGWVLCCQNAAALQDGLTLVLCHDPAAAAQDAVWFSWFSGCLSERKPDVLV